MITNEQIASAMMTIKLDDVLPEYPRVPKGIRRAPRECHLRENEVELLLEML